MLSKLFSTNTTQSFLLLLFLGFGLFAPLAFTEKELPLVLVDWLGNNYVFEGLWFRLLGFGLLLLVVWIWNQILTEQFEIIRRNAHAAWFTFLLVVTFWAAYQTVEGLLLIVLQLFLVQQIFKLGKTGRNYEELFNTGLAVGLMSFVDGLYLLLLIPTVMMYLAYGKSGWRILGLPLMAFLMLFVLTYAVLVWQNQPQALAAHYAKLLQWQKPDFSAWLIREWIWPISFLALLLFSVPDYLSTLQRANIYKRQAFSALIIWLLSSMVFMIFDFRDPQRWLPFILLPLAVFIANTRQYQKRAWTQLLYTFGLPLLLLLYLLIKL
jgi:hypothetical protein